MTTSAILMTIIITIAVLSAVLPVAIGMYVYDDAKRRKMNGVLWTLLSVFAPGFIGLIIYLIVRADHSVLNCPKCGKNISENFSVCPECGFSLKNRRCPTCGRIVERDWNVCPTCANEIPEDMKLKKIAKPRKDKGMKRILLLVILIPVFLCLLIIAGILMFSAEDVHVESFYATHVSPEEVYCSEIDIDKWISDCDKKGEGVYALKEVEEIYGISGVTTSLIVYRNDGMYDANDSLVNGTSGTVFRNPTVEISYYDPGIEYGTGLSYFEFYSDRAVDITLTTDGEITDYEVTEVSDIEYSVTEAEMYGASISVVIPEDRADVYEYAIELYQGDTLASTFGTQSSDGKPLTGKIGGSDMLDYNTCLKYDSFSVCLLDENGKEILRSEKYPLWSEDGILSTESVFRIEIKDGTESIVPY